MRKCGFWLIFTMSSLLTFRIIRQPTLVEQQPFPGVTKQPSRPDLLLVTSWYLEQQAARRNELLASFGSNIGCVSEIHLLVEVSPGQPLESVVTGLPSSNSRLVLVKHTGRPLYKDLFAYANTLKGRTVAVQNSDITWTADAAQKAVSYVHLAAQANVTAALALSRHPNPHCKERNQCIDYNGSHDVFVFLSPLRQDVLDKLDFAQNRIGAENRVIFELRVAGLTVLNPCRQIITVHEHCSAKRTTPTDRINRANGGPQGEFFKSGFASSTDMYPLSQHLLECQLIQDQSYEIPFVDKDPHALVGKNITKWRKNAERHLSNQVRWIARSCPEAFVPLAKPSEKERDWRKNARIAQLFRLKAVLTPDLFSRARRSGALQVVGSAMPVVSVPPEYLRKG
eukprot:TRINITY_DN40408_c0_g1_i1.p1 TRINITY_DN40408_c0_g1~~TRINITY_DN40408_c0_g1_i1.p1  ORF type:complete len:397 (-),score=22.50 TRINITY_DN40408_c0_g1_i1:15-1205(-)